MSGLEPSMGGLRYLAGGYGLPLFAAERNQSGSGMLFSDTRRHLACLFLPRSWRSCEC